MKTKQKKLCYKLYHQLLKQKFSREISSLCFRAHQFGIHHKKEKYLKSDNTPPLIKIVANKKILKFAPTSKPTTS